MPFNESMNKIFNLFFILRIKLNYSTIIQFLEMMKSGKKRLISISYPNSGLGH